MTKKALAEQIGALEVKVSILESHVEILRSILGKKPVKAYRMNVTSGPNQPKDRV